MPQDYTPGRKLKLKPAIGDQNAIRGRDPRYEPGKTREERFIQHVKEVLTLEDFRKSLEAKDGRRGKWFSFTRAFHLFVSWTSYSIQIVFPLLTMLSLCFVHSSGYCWLHVGTCNID